MIEGPDPAPNLARIQEAPKHIGPTDPDPDPQHYLEEIHIGTALPTLAAEKAGSNRHE